MAATNYFKSIRDGANVLYYHKGMHPVHSLHEKAATNYFKSLRDGANVLYYHKGIHPVHTLHKEAATVGTAEAAGVRVIVDAAESTRHKSNNKEKTKEMSSLSVWLLFLFNLSAACLKLVQRKPFHIYSLLWPKTKIEYETYFIGKLLF
jgi:hypothetical protein